MPPMGWRFWTLAGFPGDPLDPSPYGGSRCLALTIVDLDGSSRWLCAMELDHSFRLLCSHDLFPCPSQGGAEAFAREIIARHARQPSLF
nr:transposase [Sphingomonas beigongshangi]